MRNFKATLSTEFAKTRRNPRIFTFISKLHKVCFLFVIYSKTWPPILRKVCMWSRHVPRKVLVKFQKIPFTNKFVSTRTRPPKAATECELILKGDKKTFYIQSFYHCQSGSWLILGAAIQFENLLPGQLCQSVDLLMHKWFSLLSLIRAQIRRYFDFEWSKI